MIFQLYPKLCTCSKRAMNRSTKRYGKPYYYRPRGTLLQRLSEETGLSVEQCYVQLQKERDFLLRASGKKLT